VLEEQSCPVVFRENQGKYIWSSDAYFMNEGQISIMLKLDWWFSFSAWTDNSNWQLLTDKILIEGPLKELELITYGE
jgi:hypothetical protein